MHKDLSSRAMSDGIIRSGMILITVWTLYYATPSGFELPIQVVISGFIASNLISVFENLAKMDIVIPASVTKYLRAFKDDKGDDQNDSNTK